MVHGVSSLWQRLHPHRSRAQHAPPAAAENVALPTHVSAPRPPPATIPVPPLPTAGALHTRQHQLRHTVRALENELMALRRDLQDLVAATDRPDPAYAASRPTASTTVAEANAILGETLFTACGASAVEMEVAVASLRGDVRQAWGLPAAGRLVVVVHADPAQPWPPQPPAVSIEWRGAGAPWVVTSAVPEAQPQFRVGYQMVRITSAALANHWGAVDAGRTWARLQVHLAERITTLGEHCVVCDTPQAASSRPTACGAASCRRTFVDLGLGFDPSDVRRDPKATDLLIALAVAAGNAGKLSFVDNLPTQHAHLSNTMGRINDLPAVDTLVQAPDMLDALERSGPGSVALLQWILAHNRGRVRTLRDTQKFAAVATPHQFKVRASPEAEQAFARLKRAHGQVRCAFHGSPLRNWHSILRTGLQVGHPGQDWGFHGAVRGEGVYLARRSDTSESFSTGATAHWRHSALNPTMRCLALCEFIALPAYNKNGVYVVTDPAHVKIRYLFVYDGALRLDADTLQGALR